MNSASLLFSYDRIFNKGQLNLPSGDIMQIAELSLIQDAQIPEHIQHCDEITYVVSGQATVLSGNKEFTIFPQQIHYIKKGLKHAIIADKGSNFHYFCIGFLPNGDYSDLKGFFDFVGDKEDFVIKDDSRINFYFNSLVNEFYQSDSSKLMIHCYFCQIIISIFRILKQQRKQINMSAADNSGKTAYQILRYIDRNYSGIKRVKDIANELSYSEYYLSHVFKEKTGMSVKSYLMQKKITLALELLKYSNMSIPEIADHLNFSSVHSFDLAFRQYTGSNPTQFKKMSAKQ